MKSRIVDVVKAGNRKVAAKLVENALKTMDCGFNALHKEVINDIILLPNLNKSSTARH